MATRAEVLAMAMYEDQLAHLEDAWWQVLEYVGGTVPQFRRGPGYDLPEQQARRMVIVSHAVLTRLGKQFARTRSQGIP